LSGVLAADLDETRRAGAAERLGRVIEADQFEGLLLGGLSGVMVGGVQIVAALIVGVVVGVPVAVPLCIVVSVGVGVLLASSIWRARLHWSDQRVVITGHLTERFCGHRTEQVYGASPNTRSHRGLYERGSRRLDSARSLLIGGLALGSLAAGTAATLSAGTRTQALVMVGLAVLAWDGLTVSSLGVDDLASAFGSRHLFGPLVHPGAVVPAESRARRSAAVHLSAASYTYPGAPAPAVECVTLQLRDGEHLLLTGPSGGGKSTVASLISGIRVPERGAAIGTERTVYVPQFGDNHAFQASLAFNVLLGRHWPPEPSDWCEIDETLESLGLAPVISRMPRNLAQPIGDSGWQLSHGERTRMHLARALLQRPDVLILDETLAGLDPTTTIEILEVLRSRVSSLVMITHP
jgi:ATP-binding cassette subfamily B protein